MVIEDLTMLANQPVADADRAAAIKAEADKAAAGDTMPPAKHKHAADADDETDAGRLARRGQDPPEPETTKEHS